MKIVTRDQQGVAVLRLTGRFDAHEAPDVQKALTSEITKSKGRLLVNLSNVSFIDSRALATLVQGMKHCREAGGDLYLSNLEAPVRVIFELTRLDKAFEIFDAEEQAIQRFLQ